MKDALQAIIPSVLISTQQSNSSHPQKDPSVVWLGQYKVAVQPLQYHLHKQPYKNI